MNSCLSRALLSILGSLSPVEASFLNKPRIIRLIKLWLWRVERGKEEISGGREREWVGTSYSFDSLLVFPFSLVLLSSSGVHRTSLERIRKGRFIGDEHFGLLESFVNKPL